MQFLSEKLGRLFRDHATNDWFWPERTVTYSNAKLPEALLIAGSELQDDSLLDMGLRSLRWLLEMQTSSKGSLSIIGNGQWLQRDKARSTYDQQPVDVMHLVEACAQAYESTCNSQWSSELERCFAWYLGAHDRG